MSLPLPLTVTVTVTVTLSLTYHGQVDHMFEPDAFVPGKIYQSWDPNSIPREQPLSTPRGGERPLFSSRGGGGTPRGNLEPQDSLTPKPNHNPD